MTGNGRRKEKITAVVLAGFSILYFISCFRLELGNPSNPGPGFFPLVIGFLLTVCAGAYLARVFRGKTLPEKAVASVEVKNYRAIAVIVASGIVYPLLLGTLKFVIATFVVTFFMLYILKPRKLLSSIFLALALAIVAFLTFARLLGVGLPMGPLEIFLFHIGG
ncbi:MAG: tripartite tricarboxylate transporter TctB family protein [Thermodesulfobacteriota bacterium]